MTESRDTQAPVRTKALVVDPVTMAVLWMNEATVAGIPAGVGDPEAGYTLEQALPVSGAIGLAREVAATAVDGEPRTLGADMVSTSRGSVSLVVSVDRIPGGAVLVLCENTWQFAQNKGASLSGRPRRR